MLRNHKTKTDGNRTFRCHVVLTALIGLVSFGVSGRSLGATDNVNDCARQKGSFDGVTPLKYGDILGIPGEKIAMSVSSESKGAK
jgi:hypothetical protein